MKNHIKNILEYNVEYKPTYGVKPLPIILGKVEVYIRKYYKTRYLALFQSE